MFSFVVDHTTFSAPSLFAPTNKLAFSAAISVFVRFDVVLILLNLRSSESTFTS